MSDVWADLRRQRDELLAAEHAAKGTRQLAREEWRPLPGHERRYEVSDRGRVRSLRIVGRNQHGGRTDRPRSEALVLRERTEAAGYRSVSIAGRPRRVHQLVLEAFVGPRPPAHAGAHLNGDPADNRLVNLRWVTSRDNERHKRTHGTLAAGERNGVHRHPETVRRGAAHHAARLAEAEVRAIRAAFDAGVSRTAIAVRFRVSRGTVGFIGARKTWRHLP